MIQSVDRLSLAQEIEKQAAKRDLVQDILLEVNIGEESQKGGIYPDQLTELADAIVLYPHIRIKGIMCVPPVADKITTRACFRQMRTLFRICQERYPAITHLSMGMSGDFEIAIAEGATMIRVGSALFGQRVYQ